MGILTDILAAGGFGGDDFKRTWQSTEAAGEFSPLPPGEYICHAERGELKNARTGTPGYSPGVINTFQGVNFAPRLKMVDGTRWLGAPFEAYEGVKMREINDGLSNTMMLSETVQTTGNDVRGMTWVAGYFSTYLLPNSSEPDRITQADDFCDPTYPNPPCIQSSFQFPEMWAARSRHPGMVNASRCDGSVQTISDDIDLFVWRAFSTSAGGELEN